MKPKSALRSFLTIAGSSLLAISYSHADQIWDGTSLVDSNWNTAANWGSDTLPDFISAITFTGNTRNAAANNITGDPTIGGINFTNDGSVGFTNAFTLSNNGITLGGDITTTANTTGSTITDIISLNMILNGNRIITTNQLSSAVQHNLTISGVISQDVAGRTLTKQGAGTLTLTGANSYSGATTVSGGTLSMKDVRNYKTTALSVASGATLGINMTGAASSGAANVVGNHTAFATVNAAITGAGVVALTGTNFISVGLGTGKMTTNLSAGAVLDVQSGSWAWGYSNASAATNLGSLNVASGAEYRNSDVTYQFDALTGSGTVANAYSNTVTLTLGVNNTTNNATYGVSGNTATFSGSIKNGDSYNGVTTGALSLVKTGTGTQILSGANTYTGVTTLTDGILSVATIGNGGVTSSNLGRATNAAANIVFNGGTLQYTGTSSTSDRAFTINATKTATIETTNDISFAGATGTTTTGALTKTGAGKLTLTGNSTYTGVTTLTAGTLSVASINNGGVAGGLGQAAVAATNIVFNGGTLQYTGISATSNRAFTINADKTATIETANDISFAGATGTTTNGALTKTGAGTLTLTGTNTYTGATNVDGGKLVVNGNISTSVLTTVKNGTTLGGIGTVGALTVDEGGFFSPGNSPGIETVNGNYIQNGTLQVEIEGLTAGNGAGFHDRVDVTGTVTLGLTSVLSLTTFTGSYSADDLIFILLNDGIDAVSGTFTGLAQGATVGTFAGQVWNISYNADSTANTFTGTVRGNDIALMAIPEPRAALLGGLGMLMLLRRRR